ncbi:Uncharacterised protein [Streptococcus pneumoniae]|nr:Uncharacterised protein [Streptococcus pneumoniae]
MHCEHMNHLISSNTKLDKKSHKSIHSVPFYHQLSGNSFPAMHFSLDFHFHQNSTKNRPA